MSIFGVTRSFISLSGYCGYFKDYTPSSQTTSVTLDVTRGIGVIVKILTVSFSVDESGVSPFIHGEVFGGLLWPSNIFGWANTISFYNNGICKSGYGASGNGIAISS